MIKKKLLPGSSDYGVSVSSLDTDILSDEIIKIATPNKKIEFKLLTEYFEIPNRKAGFYNVNTSEDIELKQGETHNESYHITMDDLNNGWVRYGIYKREKTILYLSGSKREFLNKCIKFIERKYPEEFFDQYDLEIIIGNVSEPMFITLDSNKQPLRESYGQWLLSMRNVSIMMKMGFMDKSGNIKNIFE